ncbi:hypothetical protein DMP14_20630 [Pseudonocardia sp. Ae707_Ps2]
MDNRGWSAAGGQGKSGDDMADEPWRVNKDWNWVKDWCVNHTKESKLPRAAELLRGDQLPPGLERLTTLTGLTGFMDLTAWV